jgi:S1-C subfamily serine protease
MTELSGPRREHWRQRFRPVLRLVPFALGVTAALAAMLFYNLLNPAPPQLTTRDLNEAVEHALASATAPPAFSADAYQAILPSLVLIETQNPGLNGEIESGLGSGVVINYAGDILTSFHVVSGASEIMITFVDGTKSQGRITASQPENDIAVVRALQNPDGLVPAVLGNSRALRIGDEAYAVGNPFGLFGSMSAGVVSGIDRTFQPPGATQVLDGLIQVDAAVNPGNSGGPLINRDGEVVGIVVGIVNPTENSFFIGIAFAVPIDIAGGTAGSPAY